MWKGYTYLIAAIWVSSELTARAVGREERIWKCVCVSLADIQAKTHAYINNKSSFGEHQGGFFSIFL
jgi:hypothetical protein